MKIQEINALFTAAHNGLTAESIAFLSQDTATVVGPILAKMQDGADLRAVFRKGSETKAASVKIVTRAAATVGAHPLLCHLAFVLSVADSFERHGLAFQGMNLPLSFGVRIRATAPAATAPAATAPKRGRKRATAPAATAPAATAPAATAPAATA